MCGGADSGVAGTAAVVVLEKVLDMRAKLRMPAADDLRPVINVTAEKWRRKARRTYYTMRRNTEDLGMEEWFWLALLVIWGIASGYATLVSSGQSTGLW